MTRAVSSHALFLLLAVSLCFCQAPAAPQTARQALLDMFFSKTPGALEKHLPEALRAAIHKSGSSTSMLDGISFWTTQMKTHGQELQTFEAGSTLLMIEDPNQHSRFEINVERDDLRSDEDEIELSFHASKDGQSQTSGVAPKLTLTMRQEAGTWRLSDVTVTVQVSLTDPDFLKVVASRTKPATASMSLTQSTPGTSWGGVPENDALPLASLRTLLAAEKAYAERYPRVGFTCSLSDLGGMGSGGEPGEHKAQMIDPRLASGRKHGYVFSLTGCAASPDSSFKLIAVPATANPGMRAFCSDESGAIRYSSGGSAASCLSAGSPLQ